MTKLRAELPELPATMEDLPLDHRGYPVPRFVQYVNEAPDFRVADSMFKEWSLKNDLCYVCGKEFTTRHRWYVIGPMCVINRTTGEPAVHLECALFSVKGCPFLARPHATRREANMPDGVVIDEAHLARNPKVAALYSTRQYELHRRGRGPGQYILFLGEPNEVLWSAQGREATYAEVVDSMHSGFHFLVEEAKGHGIVGLEELRRATHAALPLLPKMRGGEDQDAQELLVKMGIMIGEAVRDTETPTGLNG